MPIPKQIRDWIIKFEQQIADVLYPSPTEEQAQARPAQLPTVQPGTVPRPPEPPPVAVPWFARPIGYTRHGQPMYSVRGRQWAAQLTPLQKAQLTAPPRDLLQRLAAREAMIGRGIVPDQAKFEQVMEELQTSKARRAVTTAARKAETIRTAARWGGRALTVAMAAEIAADITGRLAHIETFGPEMSTWEKVAYLALGPEMIYSENFPVKFRPDLPDDYEDYDIDLHR